jgi:uroporphyrin-III C-methyltransferase/precorrin-2 dehydrogenase/sirohydrochlorin ferrochelatase
VDFFPIFLDLQDKPVLIVGGGSVALRKANALLKAGARVLVVAPETVAGVDALAEKGQLAHHRRRFREDDITGHWLVVSASNSPGLSAQVARAAERARVFCNAVDDLAQCSYIMPAIVDRSPLLIAVSSAGNAPVFVRQLRARLEALLPTSTGPMVELAGRWRRRVRLRIDDARQRRRFWERLFGGRLPDRFNQAGPVSADALIEETLTVADHALPRAGIGLLVGAGPGDPGLLTLKALQAMQTADVIVHDRLVSDDVLALARRDAELISVGKTPGCKSNSQQEINALLVQRVAAGDRVCRLKGGDPFIFGRGGEEAEALSAAGLAYEVIPGITAAAACAAAAGIPLTHRDLAQSLTFLTGHGKDAVDRVDWAALARGRQTLASYMGVQHFTGLMQKLTAHGRPADTPIAVIERGSTPRQRVLRGTLGQLPMLAEAHRIEAPAMLIIGDVARLGHPFSGQNADPAGPPHLAPKSAIKTGAAILAKNLKKRTMR